MRKCINLIPKTTKCSICNNMYVKNDIFYMLKVCSTSNKLTSDIPTYVSKPHLPPTWNDFFISPGTIIFNSQLILFYVDCVYKLL